MLAVQGIFLAIVLWLARRNDAPWIVSAIDAVALPGQPCEIGVRLQKLGASGAKLGLVKVRLEALGAVAAETPLPALEAQADAAGTALVRLTAPAAPGTHLFAARLEASPDLSLPPEPLHILLQVAARERPIVLVPVPESIQGERENELFPGVREALPALAADRTVVFLSRRPVDTPARVRAWLQRLGLPTGPVLLPRDVQRADLGLLDALSRLSLAKWQGPHWAIATSHEDAHTLAATSATVLLVTPSLSAATKNPVVHEVKDWNEAKARILGPQ
jgi:hypothetical protein